MEQYRVSKVWVDDTHIWVETTNGWKAGYPFSQWHQLAHASQEQRQKFFLSRYGIHWPELDEDLNHDIKKIFNKERVRARYNEEKTSQAIE